ncbi:MAG: ACT domain-containing protein, partial [Desulfamplus sp.]
MRVEQISIFLENKAGRLAEVTAILRDANVNIRALSLADTTDFGILRLIVNDNQAAEQALKREGFTVGKTNVLAIEVADVPGGLNNVLDPLTSAGINVEYMYAFANAKA